MQLQSNCDNQDQFNKEFEEANAFLKLGQWREALQLYLQLDRKGFINDQLFFTIAKLYISQEKYSSADWYINKLKIYTNEVHEYKEIILKNIYKVFESKSGQLFGNVLQLRPNKNALISSAIGRPKEALTTIQQKNAKPVEPNIIVQIYLQLYKYEETIQFLNQYEGVLSNKEYLMGFCYYNLKNYKLSLICFESIEQKTDQVCYFIRLLQKYLKLKIFEINPPDNFNYESLYYVNTYQLYTRINQDEINEMSDKLITLLQSKMELQIFIFVYHEICYQIIYNVVQMKFNQSYELNKEFLWKIVEYIIINSPRYAEGYADKYLLLMKEENYQDIYDLIQNLTECDDSTTKYKYLAQIYSVLGEFSNSQICLDQALAINKSDSEIYELISIYKCNYKVQINGKMNKFQDALDVLEQYITLERQNLFLITNYFQFYIQKYQYHKAYQLLINAEQAQQIDYLILILKLLIYPSQIAQPSVLEQINKLPRDNDNQYAVKVLLQGHLMFKQQNVTGAMAQYYFSSTPLKNSNQQTKLKQVQDLLSRLKQQQQFGYSIIHDEICQLSVENYQPQQKMYLIDRFVNCFWFILSSLIFSSQYNQLIEWFNQQNDCLIEVSGTSVIPKVDEINQTIRHTVEQLYHVSKYSKDKYFSYLNKTQEQLQKIFQSYTNLYNEFAKFSEANENCLLTKIQNLEFNFEICNYPVSQLFNYPLFYDPISKLAIIQCIKLLGYYVGYCLFDEFQNSQVLFQFIFLKDNIHGYFDSLTKVNNFKSQSQ